ncbi:MAG TPA: ECF-type sigma factor [Candidatus Sulfopaludibacter sp.]|jgi:RNA polymerase sigma factor (TIGR02999 family)|nr:ECF-type sigma factor [Candidatus Sulfopaludibacter sp.]
MATLTELLEKLKTGDEAALNELVSLLYLELRRIAALHLRKERAPHTLQTTALVHEVYLKLMQHNHHEFADRVHFLAVASRAMRHVLVDYARGRGARKRSLQEASEPERLSLAGVDMPGEQPGLLDLDRALDELAQEDEHLAQLIQMRYFGGMTAEESAAALDRSVHVVRHDLRLAQAWLRQRLNR